MTFKLRLAGELEGAVEIFLVILVLPVSDEVDLSVSLRIDKFDKDPVMTSEFRLLRDGLEIVLWLLTGVLLFTELGLSLFVVADLPR